MSIVIDTNILVDFLFKRKEDTNIILTENECIAPSFIKAELGQVLWKYRMHFSKRNLIDFWEMGLEMIDQFYDDDYYLQDALSIAIKNNHGYYDSSFIALAMLTSSSLASRDKKMISIAKKLKIDLH